MYALILAGGSGTRLWPYSRSGLPKQFLALGSDRTMLQATVDRVLPSIPADHIYIATGAAYADLVAAQLPEVPPEHILVEPMGRGTAPCIGYAALYVSRRDPQAVMAVLSADHHIADGAAFCTALHAAAAIAADGMLVTLGMQMDAPSTAYGYIKRGEPIGRYNALPAYRVDSFEEKPTSERARTYCASGEYTWNGGIFIWRADVIIAELALHRPKMIAQLAQIDVARDTPEAERVMLELWPTIENVAIDVAVMERTVRAAVLPVAIGWCDVGDWSALADVLPHDSHGNAIVGHHVGLDTANSLVYSPRGHVIATIGLDDLIVVDTDDVVLVCPRARAQDVKRLVAEVRNSQHASTL